MAAVSAAPAFAALRLSDGSTVCRAPRCFQLRYDRDRFVRVARFLPPLEVAGQRCDSCGVELAPRIGAKPGLR